MNHNDDPNFVGLVLLIHRLEQIGTPLGRSTLLPFAELKLPKVGLAYEELVGILLKDHLIEGDANAFTLTPLGHARVAEVSSEHSLHAWFYNEYYQTIRTSKAHSLFCERVYGKDLGQHGMADMDQVHAAISELRISAGMRLLDFGCGDGQISEYIAGYTQARVIGVDIADQAIQIAQVRTREKRERMRFICADLETVPGTFPANAFDRILAIDSLFFGRNQHALTKLLLDCLAPDGFMGVFYIAPPQTAATGTMLARALDQLGPSYRTTGYSDQNKWHWLKKKLVLLELEPMFKAEGNDFLFKNRLAECDGMDAFQRYLYIVEKGVAA
jgi:ubiquinone/menaquinone biosynthesis C-methylase UbiE